MKAITTFYLRLKEEVQLLRVHVHVHVHDPGPGPDPVDLLAPATLALDHPIGPTKVRSQTDLGNEEDCS